MGTRRHPPAAGRGSQGALNHHLDTAVQTTVLGDAARRREFFGGIWFKVFTERGPALISSAS